jgi:quinoprotein glucose dehydrogenase
MRSLPIKPTILSLLASTCLAAYIVPAIAQDWPVYGGDLGSQKYSPLDQINAANVNQLQIVWSWESPDNATVAENQRQQNLAAVPAGYKATPIEIDGVLYIPSSFGRIAALRATSGEEIWVFDTKAWEAGRPANLGYNVRGVAYWEQGNSKRIVFATNDSYLWSIDAETGLPDPSFGVDGRVDLTQGLGREINKRDYGVVSPPIIVGNNIVVNSIVNDGPRNKEMAPGHIRAFNIADGAQSWIFHTIPQAGEFGNDTWENGSWEYTGNTNSWTIMSADAELGYVYIPIGTPTNDWYGGQRLGDNLFAESLVVLNAATGERVWHFQAVHHGVWDYDLPAAPTLVDIVVDARPIKAVALITKQGYTFVFDRVDGTPVWPIEEQTVPQGNVPGERLSPTQPVPTKPAPFDYQGISDATLIDFTPELRAEALQNIEKFDYGPVFTPPSLRGTILLPGWAGGGEWQGAAFDPDTGYYYIPSTTSPIVVQLMDADPAESNLGFRRGGATSVAGPQSLPLTKPPYSRITAINLNTGEHAWMVPHGDGIRQRIIDMGILDPGPVGSPDRTGPLVTKTLLFIAQRDGGRSVLRAFDKASGEIVHELELPRQPGGTPMTYMDNGKQYIAIALGGGADSRLVAIALP